jgi:hypothetical protein
VDLSVYYLAFQSLIVFIFTPAFLMRGVYMKEARMVWVVLLIMIVIGFLLVGAFCTQNIIFSASSRQNTYYYLNALGTAVLVGGACLSAGALVGFLFGIPRMLQNGTVLPENVNKKRIISQNDNLVQISDWLTKIIVGVGLTQLYSIPGFMLKIGDHLGPTFGGKGVTGRNEAIVTILYFIVLGFIGMYLWTRIYFTKMLDDLERQLDEKALSDIEQLKQANNRLQERSVDAGGSKKEVLPEVTSMSFNTMAKSGNLAHPDDPQKGVWGGKAEVNERKMTARVEATLLPDYYRVIITVSSTNAANPLTGFVNFHLHHTFRNQHPVIAVQDGVATLTLSMVFGAFTVGAEADGGKTQLELDLSTLADAPQEFRDR